MIPYDFSGWATRNNLGCSDGRTIMKDAFKDNDGKTVPLVWNHQHNDPLNVLGHALLENRSEGVYAYCAFNETESGKAAKELVKHGDIAAMSIYANQLRQKGGNVIHGAIREVSLVLASANPGALIDSVIAHSEDGDEEAVIYTGEGLTLAHADKPEDEDGEETIEDVLNTFSDKQKAVLTYMVTKAISEGEQPDNDDDENEEGKSMKQNVFDRDNREPGSVLCHSDEEAIISLAKSSQVGSFQTALRIYAEENKLAHADATAGGFAPDNIDLLFPEYKDLRPGAPELITNDQGWIGTVMQKVHKSPISRIRTRQVDIRGIDALRAKGYEKGKQKTQSGNFNLVRRTTDPQTVYVKNALNRDDIVDITDFDYVQYLYGIDRMMLNEELATAIMLGDGREEGDPDKIAPEHIRPIWLDDELYTIHADLDIAAAREELQGTNTGANFGENYIYAEAMINTLLYAREKFKGSGVPDLFITPHMLNVMLLARDLNGRRIYDSASERPERRQDLHRRAV